MRTLLSFLLAIPLMAGFSGAALAQSPPWTQYSGAVAGAAWCNLKDNNKPLFKKSMKKGTCAADIAKQPFYAVITEHQLGRFAKIAACHGDLIAPAGVGELAALEYLRLCQCHNLQAQVALFSERHAVISALREWGGC